jgi:hypothetical protein
MSATSSAAVEQWDFYEVVLKGPATGNPFTETDLRARFTQDDQSIVVDGFYDGEGTYRIRFMPQRQGRWKYQTESNRAELNGKTGSFECVAPSSNNHGPMRVKGTFHFEYADGTPYRQIGTTCYAWTHQNGELQEQTLHTLKVSPFNKLRFCVFPKRYTYNQDEPPMYPFEGNPPKDWDFTRLNPKFFQHFERRVAQLRDMGIEADIILFHGYDYGHWTFDRMDEASDDRYLKYVVARLAAYRNVWWSMANEFDFMKEKKDSDWDRYFHIVKAHDPYDHLRSIHNGKRLYDHNKPWVTHVSMQNGLAVADFGRAVIYRDCYYKPIVYDEVKYEGNIEQRWGNISGEEMVHCFWQGTICGTYVGHGETYLHAKDILWWAKGGVLHGTSPKRIAFLKQIMDDGPIEGIEPIDKWDDPTVGGKAGEYYLVYLGRNKPTEWLFELPREQLEEGMNFKVEVIDTWNMTITPVEQTFKIVADTKYRYHAAGNAKVKLPGKQWMALRIRRAD